LKKRIEKGTRRSGAFNTASSSYHPTVILLPIPSFPGNQGDSPAPPAHSFAVLTVQLFSVATFCPATIVPFYHPTILLLFYYSRFLPIIICFSTAPATFYSLYAVRSEKARFLP
jgi:hypothetical protein